MGNSKPWYMSKGVWGGLVALLAGVAAMLGYNLGPEDQVTLTNALIGAGSAVGGVLAVYGRVKAQDNLTS